MSWLNEIKATWLPFIRDFTSWTERQDLWESFYLKPELVQLRPSIFECKWDEQIPSHWPADDLTETKSLVCNPGHGANCASLHTKRVSKPSYANSSNWSKSRQSRRLCKLWKRKLRCDYTRRCSSTPRRRRKDGEKFPDLSLKLHSKRFLWENRKLWTQLPRKQTLTSCFSLLGVLCGRFRRDDDLIQLISSAFPKLFLAGLMLIDHQHNDVNGLKSDWLATSRECVKIVRSRLKSH